MLPKYEKKLYCTLGDSLLYKMLTYCLKTGPYQIFFMSKRSQFCTCGACVYLAGPAGCAAGL